MNFIERNQRLLLALALLGLLASVLHRALNMPAFQNGLFNAVSKVLPVRLTISRMEVGFWSGAVTLRDLSVSATDGTKVQMGRVIFHLSPFSLVRGQLIFSRLDLERVLIKTKANPQSESPSSVERLQAIFEQWNSFRLVDLNDLSVTDFAIETGEKKTFRLESLRGNLSPRFIGLQGWQCHLMAQGFRSGTGSSATPPEESLSVDLSLKTNQNGLDVSFFHIAASGLEGFAQGSMYFATDKNQQPFLSLNLEGSLEATHLLTQKLGLAVLGRVGPGPRGNPRFSIDSLKGYLGEAYVTAQGHLDLTSYDYALQFDTDNLSLRDLFGNAHSVVLKYANGLATLKGQAVGRLPALQAEADATIHDFRYKILNARRAAGHIQLKWPTFNYVADVQLSEPDKKAECRTGGDLFFGDQDPRDGKRIVEVKKLDVSCQKAALEKAIPGHDLSGELSGFLKIAGKEDDIKGGGEAFVAAPTAFGIPFRSLKTDFDVHEKVWLFRNTQLVFSDEHSLNSQGALRLEIEGETLHFSGKPLPTLEFGGQYQLETKTLTLDYLTFDQAEGRFAMRGQSIWETGEKPRIRYELKGALPADRLTLLNWFPDAGGVLKTDCILEGRTPDKIEAWGSLGLEALSLEIRDFRGSFREVRGIIQLEGQRAHLQDIHGDLDDGSFSVDGSVSFDRLRLVDMDLSVKASDFPFFIPGQMKGDLVLDLHLQGRFPSPLLSGMVDVTHGRYFRNYGLSNLVLKPILEEDLDEKKTPWSDFNQTRLAIHLNNSGDFIIDNNFISKLSLRGDLNVGGTVGQPKLTGVIQAVPSASQNEGVIGLLGVRFQVLEGHIDFNDPFKINPNFDILARQYYEDLAFEERPLVALRLKGRLDNLRIVPETASIDQRDFSCLILYGVSCIEARQTNRNTGGTIASALIGEQVAELIDQNAPSAVSPDLFRLEAGGTDQTSISKVTVGKSVTDRLSLELTSDFAPEVAERTVKANYFLTDNLLLSARRTHTALEDSRYRFNLILRFEVR